jgi:hypothetical protein
MSPPAVRWPWPWQLHAWLKLLRCRDDEIRREAWGYAFWFPAIVLLFLPAELIPAFWHAANWPTFSTTIGHLEYLWGPTALFVVALMAFTAVNAVQRKRRERAPRHGAYRDDVDGGRIVWQAAAAPRLLRAARLVPAVRRPDDDSWVDMRIYVPGSLATIAAFAAVAFVFGGYWPGAYVLWALVAFFLLVFPSILAWRFAKHVLFPTLFRTVANLESHVQMIGTAVLAFVAALAIHLSLYPWPNIAHVIQADHRIAPSVTGNAAKDGTVTVSGTVENCTRVQKVIVRSRVFPSDGSAGVGALTVPVDKNGHYSMSVKLISTPTKSDAVSVYCGRPQIGVTNLK